MSTMDPKSARNEREARETLLRPFRDARRLPPTSPSSTTVCKVLPELPRFPPVQIVGNPQVRDAPVSPRALRKANAPRSLPAAGLILSITQGFKRQMPAQFRRPAASPGPTQLVSATDAHVATVDEFVLLDADLGDEGNERKVLDDALVPYTSADAVRLAVTGGAKSGPQSPQQRAKASGKPSYAAPVAVDPSRRKVQRTLVRQRDENGTLVTTSKHLVVDEIPSPDLTHPGLLPQNAGVGVAGSAKIDADLAHDISDLLALLTDPSPSFTDAVGFAARERQALVALARLLDLLQTPGTGRGAAPLAIAETIYDMGGVSVLLRVLSDFAQTPRIVHSVASLLLLLCKYSPLVPETIAATPSGTVALLATVRFLSSPQAHGSQPLHGEWRSGSPMTPFSARESLGRSLSVQSGEATPASNDGAPAHVSPSASHTPRTASSPAAWELGKSHTNLLLGSAANSTANSKASTPKMRRRSITAIPPHGPLATEADSHSNRIAEGYSFPGLPRSASIGNGSTPGIDAQDSASQSTTDLYGGGSTSSLAASPFNYAQQAVAPVGGVLGSPRVGPSVPSAAPAPAQFNFRRLSLNHSSSSVFESFHAGEPGSAGGSAGTNGPFNAAAAAPSADSLLAMERAAQQQPQFLHSEGADASGMPGAVIAAPAPVAPVQSVGYPTKRRLSWQRGLPMHMQSSSAAAAAAAAAAATAASGNGNPTATPQYQPSQSSGNSLYTGISGNALVARSNSGQFYGLATITTTNNLPVVNLAGLLGSHMDEAPRTILEAQFSKMKWIVGKLERLLLMDGRMFFSSDPHGVMESIMDDARQLVDAEAVFVTLLDQATGELIAYESLKHGYRSAPSALPKAVAVAIDQGEAPATDAEAHGEAPPRSSDAETPRKRETAAKRGKDGVVNFNSSTVQRFAAGKGIVGHVTQTKRYLNVPSVVDCKWFSNDVDCRSKKVFAKSILCIPMIKDNELYGTLSVVNKMVAAEGSPVVTPAVSSWQPPVQQPVHSHPPATVPSTQPQVPIHLQRRNSFNSGRMGNASQHQIAAARSHVRTPEQSTSPASQLAGQQASQTASGTSLTDANGDSSAPQWAVRAYSPGRNAPPPPHPSFTEEDEGLLNLIADRMVVTLVNARRKDEIGYVQERIDLLLQNTHSMATSLYDMRDLVRMVMQAGKDLVQADSCSLVIHDSARRQNVVFMPTKYGLTELRMDDTQSLHALVIREGLTLNIPDVSKDPRCSDLMDKKYGYNTQSVLAVPLISSTTRRAFGAVLVRNKFRDIKFNADDVKLLRGFCAQASMTFEKLNHVKELDEVHNFMKRVLESIQATVIVVDENLNLISCNKSWLWEAQGLTREEYLQRPLTYYLRDHPVLVEDLVQCQKLGTPSYHPSFELKMRSRTARRVMHVKYNITPLKPASDAADQEHGRSVVIVMEDLTSEKRALDTLGRYMDPSLVKEVMSEHGHELGGVRRKIAILFSDIRSFTTLAESLEPTQVVKLLNEHFEETVDAIMAEHGILDKFIGDAVMAVFGVPFSTEADSVNACNAALRMLEALRVSNRRREAAGQRIIKIGIGINTGEVLSGNIGSTKRMEYSCIGDAVNLASRLESLTKHYHSTLLVTEFTRAELPDDQFIVREVDKVQVVGKKRGVAIFDILGKPNTCSPVEYNSKMQLIELYGQALRLYRTGGFAQARELFLRCVAEHDHDGPSLTMAQRCAQFELDPPNPDEWKGVFVPDFK